MKRAMGLIAAALVSTSVYSQTYNSSGVSNDQLLEQARQRLYEPQPAQSSSGLSNQSNLPAPSGVSGQPEFSTQSDLSGYEQFGALRANGSASNSSTGQSNGSNIGASVTADTDIANLEQPKAASRIEQGFATDPSKVPAEERERALLMNQEDKNRAVGAPGESQSGSASESESRAPLQYDNPDQTDTSRSDLTSREDRFLNGNNDRDRSISDYDDSLDQGAEVRTYNGQDYWDQQNVGAPAGSQTGKMNSNEGVCDTEKAHTSNDSTVRSSGSAMDHDDRYHVNREDSGSESRYHVNRESNVDRNYDASGNAAASEFGERSSDQVNSTDRTGADASRKSESSSSTGSVQSSGTAKDHDARQQTTPDF